MKQIIALLVMLPLLAAAYLLAKPEMPSSYSYREDPNITTWLTKKEAERLMRYHGASGLKITSSQVFIRRDDRWICVFHDPPYPLEQSVASGTSGQTILATADRP